MAEPYDLLLTGGEVLDPSQDLHRRCDVAFAQGRVAALAPSLPLDSAREVIDVSGYLVTPGLIDLHGHFFYRGWPGAVAPDAACLTAGVTTAVDAGSTGWGNYPALEAYVMRAAQTRLYAFVHLCAIGLVSLTARVGELHNLAFAQVEQAIACIEEHRERVLGVKVRIDHRATGADNALPALAMARQVAEATGTRMMVHVSGSPVPLATLFAAMRPGDIATHIFHGHPHGVLDADGRLRPEVRQAQEQGIYLDVGHAGVHIDLTVARAALAQGCWPNTLSTDIHQPPPGRVVYDLPGVMSTFLALGMPLAAVVASVTCNAAAALGQAHELGTLRVGSVGDAAVFALQEGEFTFVDAAGNRVQGSQRLVPLLTVKGGRRWRPPPED
ncbi:MAG: dihydroorotase [Candidatus Tectimicrobiota bacterium]|nr:MAG: dihydroorotase [Candidatus Tectomicrobia bacterium]